MLRAVVVSLLVLTAACRPGGLVRSAQVTEVAREDRRPLTLEPYPGGVRARFRSALPPAVIHFKARRDGRVIRIAMHHGWYRVKCAYTPVEVELDLGPLPPGEYDVIVEDSQETARVAVPEGRAAPARVAGATLPKGCG